MIIFELDLDFKYPSTQQLNFIDELESIGIKLKSVSSASNVYFDNEEIDPSEVITIANPVSGTHYFKNELGTQIKCVFIAKQSSINFQPNQPDMSAYYTKEETDEAIEEAIEGIDFPEPEIPETSTIPQKSGMDGNCVIGYGSDGVQIAIYAQSESDTSYLYTNVIPSGNTVVFNEPYSGLMIKESGMPLITDGQSFNFPDKLLLSEIYYSYIGVTPANEIYHTGYTTVDGYVFRGDSDFTELIVENVRGFINKDPLGSGIATLLVKNCGILAYPGVFNNVSHLVVDGELKYISNIFFAQTSGSDVGTPCQHITFTGKGFLKSKFVYGNLADIGLVAASDAPFTIEFPDITFNEFWDWCTSGDVASAEAVYSDFFNSSAIAKLVFKDQTITDVNQTKLENSYALVIATLEDGTVLPCRSTGDYAGWVQVANAATTVWINDTGSIFTLRNANFFKNYNFNSVKEFTNKVNIAYAFNNALDKESATEQAYLAPGVDIKDAYLDSCGSTGTLFNENRVIQNVYFNGIPSTADVTSALGTQNADAKIYFAGVLAATYSGFYHELTWKNGFGPTT